MRVVLSVAAIAFTATVAQAAAQDRDAGRQVFREYCVTCHGMEGRGDGPMTQVLTINPPDLTRLTADNKGVSDFDDRIRSPYCLDLGP